MRHRFRNFLILFAGVAFAVLVTVGLIQTTGEWLWQRELTHNMDLARQHAARVTPQLHQDARFTNVNLYAFGRPSAPFLIKGTVTSDVDLADLRQILLATRPPVPITWDVVVARLVKHE